MTLAEELDAMEASGDPAKVAIAGYARRYQSAAAIVAAAERWTKARAELSKIQATGHGSNYALSREEHTRLLFSAEGEAERAEHATVAALAAAGRPQPRSDTPKVGDWIRFMSGGRLVIDEVAYILPRASWDSTPEAMTIAHGQIGFDSIVERRPNAEK